MERSIADQNTGSEAGCQWHQCPVFCRDNAVVAWLSDYSSIFVRSWYRCLPPFGRVNFFKKRIST